MMTSFSFSVLMPVYKKDDPVIFHEAVQSVLENSIKPSQFLIVVDGPIGTDLEKVILFFKNKKSSNIEVLRLSKNNGLSVALNSGLKRIRNEIVFRADADDIYLPNRFEEQIPYLMNGYDIIGSSIIEMDKDKNFLAIREVPLEHNKIKKFLKKRSPFNHMTVGYKLSCVMESGLYPEDYHLREDYALWAVMISKGAKTINLKKTLVRATTGMEMYKRRGGINYAKGEFKFQKFLVKLKIKNILEALIDGVLRFTAFVLPNFIRAYIYINLLRK